MREAIIFLQSWALWWPAAKISCFEGARKIREGIAKSVSEIGDFLCIKSTVAIYEDTLEIAQWRKVKQLQSMWICMFGDFPCVKSTFAIYEDTLDIAVEKTQTNAINVSLHVWGFSMYKEYSRRTKSCHNWDHLWICFWQKYRVWVLFKLGNKTNSVRFVQIPVVCSGLMMVTLSFWYILGTRKPNYSWRCQCSVFFINSLSLITLLIT